MIVATYFKPGPTVNGSIAVREVDCLSALADPDGWYTVDPSLFTETEKAWLGVGQTIYLRQAHARYRELERVVRPGRGRHKRETPREAREKMQKKKWRERKNQG